MSDTRKSKAKPQYDTAIAYDEFVQDVASRVRLRCNYCGSAEWETANFDNKRVQVIACDLCHYYENGNLKPILHS